MRKTYLALAQGDLPVSDTGIIEASIARIEVGGRMQVVAGHAEGKRALTQWRLLARAGQTGLFELQPETGRIHQIRVHLAHLGCPILGDRIYGGAPAPRLMLHAAALSGPHPGGARFDIRAPLPADFAPPADAAELDLALAAWRDAP